MKIKLLFFVAAMTCLPSANAQIFKCTTGNGKTVFQDAPCDVGSKQESLNIKSKTGTSTDTTGSCKFDILGTWTQTHISLGLDSDLVEDSSQSWTFESDGKVTHVSIITQDFDYQCKADVITLFSAIKNDVKIVRYDGNSMVWKSLDFGGFLYMSR